jgi:hypothetical protein
LGRGLIEIAARHHRRVTNRTKRINMNIGDPAAADDCHAKAATGGGLRIGGHGVLLRTVPHPIPHRPTII